MHISRMFQKAKNYLWHLPKSYLMAARYGFPSKKLTLIGITGTDGKTTTCNLIYEVLNNSNYKVGLLSTIGAKIGDKLLPIPPHMTSPDPSLIQSIFRQMVDQKITHVVVEVTAHALDQFRFAGCHFTIAGITNTSHEHLDYFHDMTNYIETKGKLLTSSDISILNRDDESFLQLSKQCPSTPITYSQKQSADFSITNIKVADNLSFSVNKIPFKTNSNYLYQVNNITLAYIICQKLGSKDNVFKETIANFPFMKGRRETVDNDFNINALIDFAHTPQALEQTLISIKRNHPHGKLIVIFGATGGRDQTKRPLMGKVVSDYADVAYITADDTRNESVSDINQQIIAGINQQRIDSKKFRYFDIPNRQDAFNQAVQLAQSGDTVIACGKGHETTILHGTTEYPWSERLAFTTAFKLKK